MTDAQKPDELIEQKARTVLNNPKLRIDYFSNPAKVIDKMIPRRTSWDRLKPGTPPETWKNRRELAKELDKELKDEKSVKLTNEASIEQAMFLEDAMKKPRWAFYTILIMSIITFLVGIALIVGAFIAGFNIEDITQKALIAGLSGGGGLIATLGSIFITTRDSIRKITGDNAQTRIIFTTTAYELANLRQLQNLVKSDDTPELLEQKVTAINDKYSQLRKNVLDQLEKLTEPQKFAEGQQKHEFYEKLENNFNKVTNKYNKLSETMLKHIEKSVEPDKDNTEGGGAGTTN